MSGKRHVDASIDWPATCACSLIALRARPVAPRCVCAPPVLISQDFFERLLNKRLLSAFSADCVVRVRQHPPTRARCCQRCGDRRPQLQGAQGTGEADENGQPSRDIRQAAAEETVGCALLIRGLWEDGLGVVANDWVVGRCAQVMELHLRALNVQSGCHKKAP